jgi:hypothetical protein
MASTISIGALRELCILLCIGSDVHREHRVHQTVHNNSPQTLRGDPVKKINRLRKK